MNKGNPKLKITKTDTCRFLNDHSDRFPWVIPLLERYMAHCHRARRSNVSQFGFWLRSHRPKDFEKCYKWCLKHWEILDEVYTNVDSTCA